MKNSDEVDEEVKFIEDFLNENNYTNNKLPIALDIEKHDEPGRADEIWDTRHVLVNEMIDKMKHKGMNVIVYSNANVASEYLTGVNTELWLAYYPSISEKPNNWYSDMKTQGASNELMISKMVGWQFTDSGIPDSIDKKVDISIVYSNYFKDGSMDDIKYDTMKDGPGLSIIDIFKILNNKRKIQELFFL